MDERNPGVDYGAVKPVQAVADHVDEHQKQGEGHVITDVADRTHQTRY